MRHADIRFGRAYEGLSCSPRPLRRANCGLAEVDLGSLLRKGRCERSFARGRGIWRCVRTSSKKKVIAFFTNKLLGYSCGVPLRGADWEEGEPLGSRV